MTETMTTTTPNLERAAELLERVVVGGDLAKLEPAQRVQYYREVCESLGLNPLTQPFEYITLQGKLKFYTRKDATDQLRRIHNVSVVIVAREIHAEVYVVTARATMPSGRTDESIGAVPIKGLTGEALANAVMKAETKAKRRVTLSICGLGMLDETEIETIPAAALTVSPPQLPAPVPVLPAAETSTAPVSAPVQDWLDAIAAVQSAKAYEHLKAGLRKVWGSFTKPEQQELFAAISKADEKWVVSGAA